MSVRSFLAVAAIGFAGITNAQRTVGLLQYDTPPSGYVLFAPMSYGSTYLIDPCGREVNQWTSTYNAGAIAQLQPDGSLYRAGNYPNPTYLAGGRGGMLEHWSWDGELLWSYRISNDSLCQHHDFTVLPNGNLLVIAWDRRPGSEAIAQGRNPANTGNWLLSERILELQPIGTDSVEIVWEWKLWDHLIQSFDAGLPNHGVVADHPERVNINFYQGAPLAADWIHLNSITYNAAFDQIMVSSHNLDEIWVIDHSTTTEEAAGSTGGISGRGGDLLYRWGNPRAYDRGTPADQQLFGQHHATWLPAGHEHAGKILLFNNGLGRPAGQYSSLDILEPPVDGNGVYEVPSTTAFLPAELTWTWTAPVPTDFWAMNTSGVFPVDDGYLATDGPEGDFIFIDADGVQTWKYTNPVNNGGPVAQGSPIAANNVFRCEHYPASFPGFTGHDLTPGDEIELQPWAPLCLTTGMAAQNTAAPVLISPNPADDRAVITSTGIIIAVDLVDAGGRTVSLQLDAPGSRVELDLSRFAPGAYALLIHEEGIKGRRRERLIIL